MGPAGTGKTILTLHKIVNLCKTQPKDKILLLCSGKFTGSYCKMLEDNEIPCQRLMSDGRTYKKSGFFKDKYFEHVYDPLSSDLQSGISTKAFGQKQVMIGETNDFLESSDTFA